jgi:3'(2'), 5'-bisphosphate nucleotidase
VVQGRVHAATVDLPAQGIARTVLDEVPDLGPLPSDRPVRVVASRTRPPAALPHIIALLQQRLHRDGITDQSVEILDVGSVGAKVNEILSGRADAYVHDTGFYEWDVAAPHGVAEHYGLAVSHLDGRRVTFNHMPPYVPDLVVSRPDLAGPLAAAIREATSA